MKTSSLVDKVDVLEIFSELYDVFDGNKEIQKELNKIYDELLSLPDHTGKWLSMESGKPVGFSAEDPRCPKESCFCSECGEWLVASDEYSVIGRFCPNCGEKMGDIKDERQESSIS